MYSLIDLAKLCVLSYLSTSKTLYNSLDFKWRPKHGTKFFFLVFRNFGHFWSLNLGDRIKGLKLRHFSKLNFTYHGKLRRRRRLAAVGERLFFSLVYCGLSTAAAIYIAATVYEPQYKR